MDCGELGWRNVLVFHPIPCWHQGTSCSTPPARSPSSPPACRAGSTTSSPPSAQAERQPDHKPEAARCRLGRVLRPSHGWPSAGGPNLTISTSLSRIAIKRFREGESHGFSAAKTTRSATRRGTGRAAHPDAADTAAGAGSARRSTGQATAGATFSEHSIEATAEPDSRAVLSRASFNPRDELRERRGQVCGGRRGKV